MDLNKFIDMVENERRFAMAHEYIGPQIFKVTGSQKEVTPQASTVEPKVDSTIDQDRSEAL